MHAVQQMLAFLYHIVREPVVSRDVIYEQFFQAPFVRQYLDQEGIEEATLEASRRRCPFLLNILNACDVISLERKSVTVSKLVLSAFLVKPYAREDEIVTNKRLNLAVEAWPNREEIVEPMDLSILRELFGADFLTDQYYLQELIALRG